MNDIDPISDDHAFFGDTDPNRGYNRVWFNIMRAHRKFHPHIAKALKSAGISDPIWYEILLEIERAGASGHMMADLEKTLFVPQYSLSRHVARMEKDGLLRRTYIADGRRKQILFLTAKGNGLHATIWPVYHATIQQQIGPHLSPEDAYALSRILIKLLP